MKIYAIKRDNIRWMQSWLIGMKWITMWKYAMKHDGRQWMRLGWIGTERIFLNRFPCTQSCIWYNSLKPILSESKYMTQINFCQSYGKTTPDYKWCSSLICLSNYLKPAIKKWKYLKGNKSKWKILIGLKREDFYMERNGRQWIWSGHLVKECIIMWK